MIETMKTFNKDNEEAKDLNRFFNLISRYNQRIHIKNEVRENIERHMVYRWNNDKNLAISKEEDIQLLTELPDDVKTRIFKNFLFSNFLERFGRFLTIFKSQYVDFKDQLSCRS